MNPLRKLAVAINQLSTTNAATASGNVDTLGYDFAEIDVIATSSNNVHSTDHLAGQRGRAQQAAV